MLSHSDHSIDRRIAAMNIVPGENQVFIDSDYSQIELVVLAHVLKV
jgi:DNA polymerase I-like protein with 3'-5' exonuclease and polymerase domains